MLTDEPVTLKNVPDITDLNKLVAFFQSQGSQISWDRDLAEMRHAAALIRSLGPRAVLIKGGHMEGEILTDLLSWEDGEDVFQSPRLHTPHTHGTGCTLASAIAASLALGYGLRDAVVRARAYLEQAILTAPGFGHGHGPLNHGHTVAPFPASGGSEK